MNFEDPLNENYYIDDRIYFYYLTEKMYKGLEKSINQPIKNDTGHFTLSLTYILLEEEKIYNKTSTTQEMSEEDITTLSVLYNYKNNLYYYIVNNADSNQIRQIKKNVKMLVNGYNIEIEFKKNLECYNCNKAIYCTCTNYNKKIPFALCRINSLIKDIDSVRSIYKSENVSELVHFCCSSCEEDYYNSLRNSTKKFKID